MQGQMINQHPNQQGQQQQWFNTGGQRYVNPSAQQMQVNHPGGMMMGPNGQQQRFVVQSSWQTNPSGSMMVRPQGQRFSNPSGSGMDQGGDMFIFQQGSDSMQGGMPGSLSGPGGSNNQMQNTETPSDQLTRFVENL